MPWTPMLAMWPPGRTSSAASSKVARFMRWLAAERGQSVIVIGLPSVEWGESVTAFVVGTDGEPDVDALMALADEELTAYKRPRAFRVVGALPRNAMGKVIRRDLR